eukprot:Hpha_TRINITY_DN9008_c0_g2::TRINITY_DN9008_c0_g2_i1::g.141968::m.141968
MPPRREFAQKFRDVVRTARQAQGDEFDPHMGQSPAPNMLSPSRRRGSAHGAAFHEVYGFGLSPRSHDVVPLSSPPTSILSPGHRAVNSPPPPTPIPMTTPMGARRRSSIRLPMVASASSENIFNANVMDRAVHPIRQSSQSRLEVLRRRMSAPRRTSTMRSPPPRDRLQEAEGIDYKMLCAQPEVREMALRALVDAIEERTGMLAWRRPIYELVTENKVFDRTVLTLIFLNCVILAMEDPTDTENKSTVNQIVYHSEYVFTACFTVEMIVRIMGLGLIRSSFAYLRDPYNVMDCVIVLTGIASLIANAVGGGQDVGVGGLRAFRVLRPLRAVTKVREVQTIVNSLIQSIPKMVDVMLLYLFFILMMGIIAVQLWKGKLRNHCIECANGTDPAIINDQCPTDPWYMVRPLEDVTRVCNPRHSVLYSYNCPWGYACGSTGNPSHGKVSFDNVGAAMLTLFTAVTMEGWSGFMYDVSDSTTQWASVYFVCLMLLGAFYIINLTLVIINDAFDKNLQQVRAKEKEIEMERQRQREARSRSMALIGESRGLTGSRTMNQSTFELFARQLTEATRGSQASLKQKKKTKLRERVAEVVRSKHFTWAVMACIMLNTLFLASEHYGQSDTMGSVLWWADVMFTSVFTLESALKILCFSRTEFFADKFNLFDACVAVASVVDITLLSSHSTGVSVLRTFRLFRLFKLAKQFPTLWLFFQAVMRSVEGVAVLTVLLGLVIFVYALLGMQFFGGRFCGAAAGNYPDPPNATCADLPRENYDHLGWSLLTVFQIITGEDWNIVMYNGMHSTSDVACLYFISLFVIGNYVVLNLFVAVLLGGLDESAVMDEDGEE